MFKNLSIYKLGQWPADESQLADAMLNEMFAPASPTQQKSVGWISPRENGGRFVFVESIAGQWLARFCIETRSVPAQALKEAVEDNCADIFASTGRHPGKKERRDLKDDALRDLLPRAFPKRTTINVWIRSEKRQLVIGTDSQSKADEAINSLVRVAGQGFTVAPLQTKVAPQAAMAQWIADDDVPEMFDIRSNGTFEDPPEKVRFDHVGYFLTFAGAQIQRGNLPVRLSLNHSDRVDFDLTDKLTFKSIKLVDIEPDPTAEEADRFDSECALWTGSLAPVIDSVVEALGGEA